MQVPFRRFIVIDMVCATAVIGTFFGLSYYFGDTIVRWIRGAELGLTGILAIAVAVVAGVYIYRRRKKKLASAVKEILETAAVPQKNPGPAVEANSESNKEDSGEDAEVIDTMSSHDETIVAASNADSAANK